MFAPISVGPMQIIFLLLLL